jgi:hypothetical protein
MATPQTSFSFSPQPFLTGIAKVKSAFTSDEFIYGKLELPSSLQEFFHLPEHSTQADYPCDVLMYKIEIEKQGERMGSSNAWCYTKIAPEQKKMNSFFFDVLPEPSQATTMICGLSDYSSNVGAAPLYMMFDRNHFPESGQYKVKIEIKYWTFDPYNPETPAVEQEWTTVWGDFTFEFDTKDLREILINANSAATLVKENARVKAMEGRGLPEEWNWTNNPIEPAFTEQQLIDLFLAREGDTCKALKMISYPVRNPRWIIEKNSNDFPLFKWHNQLFGFFAENNGRYFYITGGLRQTHEGGGVFGEVFFQWTQSVELSAKFIAPALASDRGKKKPAKEKAAKSKK